MWKDYSKSYIRNNRTSGISMMAAAFITALFLSLLCSLAYNFWTYEIERIVHEEGDWQGRLVGDFDENDLSVVQSFANVERAAFNTEWSEEGKKVIDVCFVNKKTVFTDLPLAAEQLGIGSEALAYHDLLLSRYFIHNPADDTPPLLMAFFVALLLVVSFSLILIIRNSFEISMNARIHQFGIFSSIGATPKQIRTCLLQEASVLCVIPIVIGSALGILLSLGLLGAVNYFARDLSGRLEVVFQYHPAVLLITLVVSFFTVFLSAWIPARKLSKMTPLEAIRNGGGLKLKRKKHSRLLKLLFGMEGELAGNALKAQRKALRISTLSLLLSFLGFSVMLVFTTLSDISTRYTYFERYKDAWDVMVTVKNTAIERFDITQQVRDIEGIGDVAVYQKAEKTSNLAEDEQSEELLALGGLNQLVPGSKTDKGLKVKAQLIIMEDQSFLNYCQKLGIPQRLDGAIVWNQIWDSLNSNFRSPTYIPFLKESKDTILLYQNGTEAKTVELPILDFTTELPVLREEYDDYVILQFIPVSLWKENLSILGRAEDDCYLRAFSGTEASLDGLNKLEQRIDRLVEQKYTYESENRIQEQISNDDLILGMKMIFGGFCGIIAVIGIANVFSNTLGFIRQRKREFAQYMSIGLTPSEMKRMFIIEATVIAGRPLSLTLILTVLVVELMTYASHLDSSVFWTEAPVIPILVFAALIAGFVALAYYIGGRRILHCDLNETLRNDTLT